MKMKWIVLIAVLVTGLSFAESGTPEARAAAEKLMEVLRMGENFDNSIDQALQMQEGMLQQMGLSEEEMAAAREGTDASMKIVREKFSWEKLKPMFIDIYAEVFTGEELSGIVAFYESPAGQKFVVKQPQLAQVTMQKMQAVMGEMMQEIQAETQRIVEQIKAESEADDAEMM